MVGLRTDNFNFRSQKAIEALGAKKDGVLRHHQARRDGTVRDSVMYSILKTEWPDVRRHLELRLALEGRPKDPAPDACSQADVSRALDPRVSPRWVFQVGIAHQGFFVELQQAPACVSAMRPALIAAFDVSAQLAHQRLRIELDVLQHLATVSPLMMCSTRAPSV